jgi:hypothetical protein
MKRLHTVIVFLNSFIKDPTILYGVALAKTGMALEFGDQGIDISDFKPSKKISKSIQDAETLLAKNRFHKYRLG